MFDLYSHSPTESVPVLPEESISTQRESEVNEMFVHSTSGNAHVKLVILLSILDLPFITHSYTQAHFDSFFSLFCSLILFIDLVTKQPVWTSIQHTNLPFLYHYYQYFL